MAEKKRNERLPSAARNHVIRKNISTIMQHRYNEERRRSLQERLADAITRFSGSMLFVYLHMLWFAAWILLNAGWLSLKSFDPFPYGLLTMIVSLEAIFLSSFVLISQNRMSRQDQKRAELDLQINLLTERELTRVLQMLDEIQDSLGIENKKDSILAELEEETSPEDVLRLIEREELPKQGKE